MAWLPGPGCVTHFRNYASVLDVPRYLRFRKASARLGGALENVMQTSSLKLRNQILDGPVDNYPVEHLQQLLYEQLQASVAVTGLQSGSVSVAIVQCIHVYTYTRMHVMHSQQDFVC